MQILFNDNVFSVTVTGCNRPVGNVRTESEIAARNLYNQNDKIMLGLSGGLDSQIVLHSFYSQSIPLSCAFLYMPGFNDFEYNNVVILKNKFDLDLTIIDLDPNAYKDELIEEYNVTGIPPFQLLHKKFLNLLPNDCDFIQGLDGPDLVNKNNTWNVIQTANSFVNSRTRAMQMLPRSGQIIAWEKIPEILLSILTDDAITSYMCAHKYIVGNGLSYQGDVSVPLIDHFDLYMKPFMYAKYWGNELEYFPKYQGPENVSWIMNTKWHDYRKNIVFLPYYELITCLQHNQTRTYYQEKRKAPEGAF
jgi:hypothetical protein